MNTDTAESVARELCLSLPDDATREQDRHGNQIVTYGGRRFAIFDEYDIDGNGEEILWGWRWARHVHVPLGWMEAETDCIPVSEAERLREVAARFVKWATE